MPLLSDEGDAVPSRKEAVPPVQVSTHIGGHLNGWGVLMLGFFAVVTPSSVEEAAEEAMSDGNNLSAEGQVAQ